MILQALAEQYEALAQKGEIVRRGRCTAKVSFALCLDEAGNLIDVLPLKETVQKGKKSVEVPYLSEVPQQIKRSVDVTANLLCDHAGYLLGMDNKGKPERTARCFAASAQRHRELLEKVDSPAARAICAYFERWLPDTAAENAVLSPYLTEILKGGNLIFRVNGQYAQEDFAIIKALEQAERTETDTEAMGRCLVTGEEAPIARLHGLIKGVRGAQSSGASVVSFNADAFCSYGKNQSYNAPVSERAVFAYTTALNHLLADREHVRVIGDTTVVYWAQTAEKEYQDVFSFGLDPQKDDDENTLLRAMDLLAQGRCPEVHGFQLSPDTQFYILGLAPNAARLSIRFFHQNTFGKLMENLNRHYSRLEIVKPKFDERERLSVGSLLFETVNQKSKDKAPKPLLAGTLMRAVFADTPYPAGLMNGVMLRIRAEQGNVTRGRAAIIKAVLLKNDKNSERMEAAHVELNEQSTYTPYLLGRLFSLLEDVQLAALGDVNATIRDRYFNSACSTPALRFSQLIKLENHHMRVLKRDKPGLAYKLEKQIGTIMASVSTEFPATLSLQDQGVFMLGYYHQNQNKYSKKEKEE